MDQRIENHAESWLLLLGEAVCAFGRNISEMPLLYAKIFPLNKSGSARDQYTENAMKAESNQLSIVKI